MENFFKTIFQNSGISLLNAPFFSKALAYYDQDGDLININFSLLKLDYANPRFLSILLHELAHATGHMTRLKRPKMTLPVNQITYLIRDIEECIAERTAQKLMLHLKIDTFGIRHFSNLYLEYYSVRLDESSAEYVEQESDKALEYILNWAIDKTIAEAA